MTDWPLQNICEPHETNDVLLWKKTKTIAAQYFSPTENEPKQGSSYYEGNQRFLELLRARQDDYKLKSSMEKPLVSLELLKQWRTQVPPGRFLIATHSGSAPPLWKDVGDKEARSRISKALKQLSSNNTSSVSRESSTDSTGETKSDDGGPNTIMSVDSATLSTASPTTSATASLEENHHDPDNNNNNASNNHASGLAFGKERTISDRPVPRSIPRHQPGPAPLPQPAPTLPLPPPKSPSNPLSSFPRITKPSKLGGRRISAQLQKANKQGRIYGRWDERDQLLNILKGQIRSKQRGGSRCNKRLNSSLSEASSGTGSNSGSTGTAAAQDRKVDLVLIRGPLGVGKTSLARTLKNPLALTDDDDQQPDLDSRPSFFLEAKFEQLMNPNPYKAFLDVFNDFCHQLLRGSSGEIHYPSPASDDNGLLVEQCRDAILDAFQEDVDVLLKLIPALEPIVYPCCEASGQSSSNRPGSLETKSNSSGALMTQKVKGYFVLLLQTIASLIPQYPVVVLFNDIHWASEISLDILTTLIADVGHSSTSGATTTANRAGIIFVGSICDCQDAKPYFKPAMQFLANRRTVKLHNIVVDNLKEGDVRDFLVDTLDCTYEKVLELAPMLYRLSKGNPMILHEFLRKMQDHGFLYTDETGEWTFDLAHMQCQFQQARTFPEMLRIKLNRFSKEVRKTVMYAACLGSSTIDTTLLGLVDPDNYASHLEQMAEVGMLRKRDGVFQFSIDGVQHKLYSMIPAEERASYHLCIAQKLWQHLDERKDKEFLFILLNQLMLGDTQVKADDDRRAVAALCLRAGELAAKTLGFHTAWVYLEHGIQILPQGDKLWGRENYDLSLRLHNAACEVCYANAQWDTVDDLVEAVLEHGRVFDDTLIARSTKIYALGSRHRLDEAVDVALDTLNQLGEWFPSQPAAVCVAAYFRRTKAMLRGKADDDIMKLKPMTEKGVLAKMLILNHSFLYAYHARPYLAGLISLRMVELTIKHGISDLASVAFCFYAMLLVSVPEVEEGLRYGKLGLKLYEKFRNEAWLCRVWSVYYGIVSIAKDPMLSTLEPLRHAKRVGLRTGDIEFAMFSGMMYLHNAGHSLQLPMLKEEIRKLTTEMEQTGHTLALAMIQPITNCISKLTAGQGEVQEEREASSEGLKACSNEAAELWMQYSSMSPAFMYGDFDLALKYSKGLHHLYTKHGNVSSGAGLVIFFECMAKLAHAKKNRVGYLRYMPYVKRRLKMLQEWTYLGNENLLGKFLLLKAEVAAVRGNLQKACLHCRSGILHSREQRQIGMEAFANEKLAMYLLEMGKADEAIPYFDESCRVYEYWGAKGKVEQLRKFRESLLVQES